MFCEENPASSSFSFFITREIAWKSVIADTDEVYCTTVGATVNFPFFANYFFPFAESGEQVKVWEMSFISKVHERINVSL